MLRLMSLTAITLFSTAAAAGDIVNKDTKTYKVDITCDGATSHTTIGPNTTQQDVVSKGCLLKLNGGGAYTVQGDKNVVIQSGKAREIAPDKDKDKA